MPIESYQTISKVNIVGPCCQAFVSGCCAQMLCSCLPTKWSTLTSVLLAFWFYSFKTFTQFFSYMSSIFLGSLYEKHSALTALMYSGWCKIFCWVKETHELRYGTCYSHQRGDGGWQSLLTLTFSKSLLNFRSKRHLSCHFVVVGKLSVCIYLSDEEFLYLFSSN